MESWLKSKGMFTVKGNFNLTAMQQVGIVTDGFEHAPYIDQMYNPPHIPKLLDQLGYSREFPMTTFEMDVEKTLSNFPLKERHHELLRDQNYQFEKVSLFNVNSI